MTIITSVWLCCSPAALLLLVLLLLAWPAGMHDGDAQPSCRS
jgi:hypothetical protein